MIVKIWKRKGRGRSMKCKEPPNIQAYTRLRFKWWRPTGFKQFLIVEGPPWVISRLYLVQPCKTNPGFSDRNIWFSWGGGTFSLPPSPQSPPSLIQCNDTGETGSQSLRDHGQISLCIHVGCGSVEGRKLGTCHLYTPPPTLTTTTTTNQYACKKSLIIAMVQVRLAIWVKRPWKNITLHAG